MQGKTRKCPHCGEIIDINATICPVCAEDIPQKEDCPFCGEDIDKSSEICPYCGEKIESTHTNKKTINLTNINIKNIVNYIIKTIFIIILLVVIYFIGNGIYMHFMLTSSYGLTKLAFKDLEDYRNACTADEQLKAINSVYAIASNGIRKNKDDDMYYAIKGYAAWVESVILSNHNTTQIKNSSGYKESVELTNKALSINPNNYIALQTSAGYSLTLDNDTNKALEYLNKAIEQNPKYAILYYLRANVYIRQNVDNKFIVEDLNNAIKYAPKASEYYRLRAVTKINNPAEYKSALKDANKAINLCKNPPSNRYMARSLARYLTGNVKGALEDCDKTIELEKDDNVLKVYQEYKKELESKL